MNITKCDICKKAVKDYADIISVRAGFNRNEFCKNCGLPILEFLKKYKFIKENNKKS